MAAIYTVQPSSIDCLANWGRPYYAGGIFTVARVMSESSGYVIEKFTHRSAIAHHAKAHISNSQQEHVPYKDDRPPAPAPCCLEWQRVKAMDCVPEKSLDCAKSMTKKE